MYGYELLKLMNEEQLDDLGLEGVGVPVDLARAETDPGYVLDIFDAAPVSSLHVMEDLSGGGAIDWARLQQDAGEGYVIQSWSEEEAEAEAQGQEKAEAEGMAQGPEAPETEVPA